MIDQQKDDKANRDTGNFFFDQIYNQEVTNYEVYEDSCKSIVDSFTQGYNGTLFAYGQTTSGKTHTMLGTKDQKGLLHHSMQDIFSFTESVSEERDVTIWVSYMEIYNESVNDLLDSGNTNLRIREDPADGYFVSGLKTMRVSSLADMIKIINLGERSSHYR